MKRMLFLLGIIPFVSCTNNAEDVVADNNVQQVVMEVKAFNWGNATSRTSINVTNEGIFYYWAENDTVGIFPDQGTQVAFPIMNGTGSSKAVFNGGAWALKPASKYAAYYPFIKRLDFNNNAVPVCYDGQIQKGKTPTVDQGRYDFMIASAVTPETGKVTFTFNHLNALLELNIPVPSKGTLTSVTLNCDEPVFVRKGTFDLTSTAPQITAMENSKSIKVDVSDITTTADKEEVKVYLLMAPENLTGKNITATIVNNGIEHTGTIEPQNYLAGHAYKVPVTIKKTASNSISINDFSAKPGNQVEIPVELTNTDDICGFQFDLIMPKGLSVAKDEVGYIVMGDGRRVTTRTHTVDSNLMYPGEPGELFRVLCFSTKNTVIQGTSGTVVYITFNIDASMAEGNYDIQIKNVTMSDPKNTRIVGPDKKTVLNVTNSI